MYNKVFLIGRLVRDPEVRTTVSGIAVARFTIAVDRSKRRDTNEKITDFLRIVTWRRQAEIAGQYLRKGKLVAIEGRLQLESYEKDGEKQSMAEIVADTFQMLDSKASTEADSSVSMPEF
ncbi:MAG: single-stranded DNA-binding protein [Candidatus Margulisiibacteriota bacterium]